MSDTATTTASNKPTHDLIAVTKGPDEREYSRDVGVGWTKPNGLSVWIPDPDDIDDGTNIKLRRRKTRKAA